MLSGYTVEADINELSMRPENLSSSLVELTKHHLNRCVSVMLSKDKEVNHCNKATLSFFFPWFNYTGNVVNAGDPQKPVSVSREQEEVVLELNKHELEVYRYANTVHYARVKMFALACTE
jgi:hypothetical protein